jgi:hypothetical protein
MFQAMGHMEKGEVSCYPCPAHPNVLERGFRHRDLSGRRPEVPEVENLACAV